MIVTLREFFSTFSLFGGLEEKFSLLATKSEKLVSGSLGVHNPVYEGTSECEAQAGFEPNPPTIP